MPTDKNPESNNPPLAEVIRPRTWEEFLGQEQLKPKIKAVLDNARPSNIIFFGPPGTGKSTLAILLAKAYNLSFIRVSAPEIGLKGLREKIKDHKVIILDEIHRFSKTQQDFFLPLLENGQLVLLATTTENPSFSITRQLLSRMHVLQFRPLDKKSLKKIGTRALQSSSTCISEESLDILVHLCQGDARTLVNLIELCLSLPKDSQTPERLQDILPELLLHGDRTGDNHYDLASALIKSIRGSDPDAALYYLAGMIESGEDPRFICRRLIIAAAEDIGLADPYALCQAVACAQAVELIGMPEGFIPLAETTAYLSLAPKSNSTYAAYLAAKHEIENSGLQPIPLHLRNAPRELQKNLGFGQGYKYPHHSPSGWVKQDYLPPKLKNKTFYNSKNIGQEQLLNRWRNIVKNRQDKIKTKP